jgi:hypothetical protein
MSEEIAMSAYKKAKTADGKADANTASIAHFANEVTNARGASDTLEDRLDGFDAQLAEKANKDEVTNVMTPKGNIAYASLPTTGNEIGWYYYCPDGDGTHGAGNYVWNGASWYFGGTGDEGYNTLKRDLCDLVSGKTIIDFKSLNWEVGKGLGSVGNYKNDSNYIGSSDYVKLPSISEETILSVDSGWYVRFALYSDKSESALIGVSADINNLQGTTPKKTVLDSSAKYIRLCIRNTSSLADIDKAHIEYNYGLLEKIKEENSKMYVKISDNVVSVNVNDGNNVQTIILKNNSNTANELFDFFSIGVSEKSKEEKISRDFANSTVLIRNTSDFLGPYQVSADNNRDGDSISTGYFTGGGHNFLNLADKSATATARTIIDTFYVDGNKVTEFEGYANIIEIRWHNFVQAFNTTKEDGTGREVLREDWHMIFDGYEWRVSNMIKALENITIRGYYGIQITDGTASLLPFDVKYLGARNTSVASSNYASNCGDNYCRHIVRTHEQIETDMWVNNVGLGEFYTNLPYCAFTKQNSKSYFNLIKASDGGDAISLQAGQILYLEGGYRFRLMNN